MAGSAATGRCLCGACTWRATAAPVRVGWCHCTMCRRHSGAPAAAFAIYRRADLALDGPVSAYASSPGARRLSCGTCGSTLAWDGDGEPTIDVAVGTADDMDALVPTYELFAADAGAWTPRQAGIVRFLHERDGPTV